METVSFENSETENEESSLLTHHKLRLYGRENEIDILRQALESCRDSTQVIWINGPSGVGKSKLVEHCFQEETHFCAGKFDFFPSPKPYSTITKALSHIIDFLSNAEYPSVKVSPDAASILIKLIPSASKVLIYEDIEGISHSQRLKISESRVDEWGFQKLKQAIKTFVKGACKIFLSMSSPPLILYMNELQWADANSLDIIKYLLLDDISWKGLLFIGSYRDEELKPDSALLLCKTDVEEKSNASVKSISLDNLMLKDVNQIISDLTNTDSSFSLPLAELIYAKTNGNPLDTISSLKFLCEKHIVRYSKSSGSWLWHEINSLLDIGLSANDVLALTFSSLPFETVEMLKISSCLGLEVDISLLHIILESFGLNLTSDKFKSLLKDAVSRQLIEMDGNGEFFYFLHDRIQYAAYQLVCLKETQEWTHLKIGRCILGCDEKFDQSLLYNKTSLAVDQLNRGRSLIVDQNEKIQLAQLNLDAADEFITASAFKMAQENLLIVIEITGADRWNQFYDLSMSSHLKLAKAYFGDGSMDQTLIQVDEICQNSKTDDDRKTAQILRLEVLSCSNRLSECMDFSLELLAELGHAKIPKNPGLSHVITSFFRVKKLLKKMSNEDILNLHECCDHRILCVLKISKFSSILYLLYCLR
jgi:predicted ATPase